MITARIKNLLRNNLIFVSLRLRSLGKNPDNFIAKKGVTDICIEGYPRCANSFSVRMFRQANPEAIIAHHTHSIANIHKAIKCKIPTVILIRNPEHAIASSIIAHKNNDVNNDIYHYIKFYNWVSNQLNNVFIADFDRVVNDFNTIILGINARFDKSFLLLSDSMKAEARVKEDIEKRYNNLGIAKSYYIKPVPTKQRNENKKRLYDSIIKHNDFQTAKTLYNHLVSGATVKIGTKTGGFTKN